MSFDLAHLQSSVWPLLEQAYGLPAGILRAIAQVETGGTFNPSLVNSSSKAKGLFQLRPIALEQVRLDSGISFDPLSPGAASAAAAILLRRYFRMFKDTNLAIAAYNAGEGNVRRFVTDARTYGTGRLPAETVNYIPKVLGAL